MTINVTSERRKFAEIKKSDYKITQNRKICDFF